MAGNKRTSIKNLPQRNLIVKIGHHHHARVVVPAFEPVRTNYQDLYNRCRDRWARIRENLDLGRPDMVQLIFDRRVTQRTPDDSGPVC